MKKKNYFKLEMDGATRGQIKDILCIVLRKLSNEKVYGPNCAEGQTFENVYYHWEVECDAASLDVK